MSESSSTTKTEATETDATLDAALEPAGGAQLTEQTPPGEAGPTVDPAELGPMPVHGITQTGRAKSVKVGTAIAVEGAGIMLRHPDGTVATAGRVITFNRPGKGYAVISTVDGAQVEQTYNVKA